MTDNDSFIDDDYKVPHDPGEFLNLEEGTHTIRPLSKPLIGWEAWRDGDNEKREVIRRTSKEEVEKLVPDKKPKHFWGLKVFNQDEGLVQTLIITQKTIQDAMVDLARNPKWGNPVGTEGYDMVITRTGKTRNDTKYSVIPDPREELSKEALDVIEATPYNLNFIVEGKYPIGDSEDDDLDF